jgi:hypothetical protein
MSSDADDPVPPRFALTNASSQIWSNTCLLSLDSTSNSRGNMETWLDERRSSQADLSALKVRVRLCRVPDRNERKSNSRNKVEGTPRTSLRVAD